MANWLTFALAATSRTEGCDILQGAVSAHTALARRGRTNFRKPPLHPRAHLHQHPHHTTAEADEPRNWFSTKGLDHFYLVSVEVAANADAIKAADDKMLLY